MTTSPDRFINQWELRVFGLQRSGIHAIVNWIVQQSPGPTLFVNDIKALTGNPFLKADDFHLYNGAGEPTGRFDVAAERRGVHASKNYLILGYEDMDLREVPVGFAELLRGGVGASGRVKNILIIRDPFNLFASRFGFLNNANRHRMETQGEYVRDLWKLYAREALGRTGYLGEGLLVVKFNLWFVDPDYRRQVAESLGLAFTDQGLEAVPGVSLPRPEFGRFGCGSSFDNQKFHGRAQQMEVLARWKRFAEDERYLRLLADPELAELSNDLFGRVSDTDNLTPG